MSPRRRPHRPVHDGSVTDREPRDAAPMRWATVPNAISLLRLVVFVPLVVALVLRPGAELWAAVALALFAGTDWIDGFLARRLGQVSRVGEVLDPLADRVGVIAISITMAVVGVLPVAVIVTIVVVDAALLVIGLLRVERVREGHVLYLGKVKTALMMVSLPLLLVARSPELVSTWLTVVAVVCVTAATVLHVLVAAMYAVRYLRPADPPVTR